RSVHEQHGTKCGCQRQTHLRTSFDDAASANRPREELIRWYGRWIALSARDCEIRTSHSEQRRATRLKHRGTQFILSEPAHRLHAAGIEPRARMENTGAVARDSQRGAIAGERADVSSAPV